MDVLQDLDIILNFTILVTQKKKVIEVWSDMRVKKRWQNFLGKLYLSFSVTLCVQFNKNIVWVVHVFPVFTLFVAVTLSVFMS